MTARLFVALELPDPVVAALDAWRAPLLQRSDELRAVPRASLHVTLTFLGWMPEDAVPPLAELVERCAADAGAVAGLALGEPLWLPRRRPRVLAVALDDRHGQLAALQAKLVERLVAGGWFEAEARPYVPHVTVARVRRGAAVRARALPPTAAGGGAPPALAFEGAAIVLYRSHLSPRGARYEPLAVGSLA